MSERIVLLRLFCVSLIWGCNYVASAYLLREFSPVFLSFIRLFFISLLMVSVAVFGGMIRKPTRKEWGLLAAAGFFGTLLNQLFYFRGLSMSTAGNAALIAALSPILTAVLARIFLKEAITKFKAAGITLGFAGIVLIVVFSGKTFGISLGDLFLLASTLGMTVALLFVRNLTFTMSSYEVTIYSTVFGTALMVPAVTWEAAAGQLVVGTSWTVWLLILAVAILGQGLTGFWWNQGVSVVGAGTSSMFMNVPPFVAIIVAHFLLGDPIYWTQIVGGCMILLGVTIANRQKKAPEMPAAPDTPVASRQ